jgi:hypothetical protein
MKTRAIATIWAPHDEISPPVLLFFLTSSILNIKLFPFCGLNVLLVTPFQRKKLSGIAKKMPEFSATADQAAVTAYGRRQSQTVARGLPIRVILG